MDKHFAYIGQGGNLGNVERTIHDASRQVSKRIGPIVSHSQIHTSRALVAPGSVDDTEPLFLNSVIVVETSLSAEEVLAELLEIELLLGRDRKNSRRWGPRVIDLDLLFYDSEIINSPTLTVPHPEIQNRDFVLVPLHDIAPNFFHPKLRRTITELLDEYLASGKPILVRRADKNGMPSGIPNSA